MVTRTTEQRRVKREAARAQAEALRCPACERKGAMVGVPDGDGYLKRTCRWADCGHRERVPLAKEA